ncbi:hypothetical protein AGMMS49992_26050 [Clostridia bacterium]|nr:hypothetical protein AGMMS49992_26050 [Clostridia bacterium]
MARVNQRIICSANLCDALSGVINSIAQQETAIACVLQVEAAKLRHVMSRPEYVSDESLLDVNKSIGSMVDTMDELESVLVQKLDASIACLTAKCNIADCVQCAAPASSISSTKSMKSMKSMKSTTALQSDAVSVESPIPAVSISVVEWRPDGNNWLVAHIHGLPQKDDRIYLRHKSRLTAPGRGIKPNKRMSHPQNPPGAVGGNLPDHLANPGLFKGGRYFSNRGFWSPIQCRTEWELDKPDQVVPLLPMTLFNTMISSANMIHCFPSFLLDFVVARPILNEENQPWYVTYGPPSRRLFLFPERKRGKKPIHKPGDPPDYNNGKTAELTGRWIVKFN